MKFLFISGKSLARLGSCENVFLPFVFDGSPESLSEPKATCLKQYLLVKRFCFISFVGEVKLLN